MLQTEAFLLLGADMRRVLTILGLAFVPALAWASPQDVMGLLESLCMTTDGKWQVIEKMVKSRGGTELPPNLSNADPAMAALGGKSYLLQINAKKYVVGVTTQGGCSVLATGLPNDGIRNLIAKSFPLSEPKVDSSGAQVITLWTVLPPSRFQAGAIMLNVAKSGYGVDGAMSVGYLPPHLAR